MPVESHKGTAERNGNSSLSNTTVLKVSSTSSDPGHVPKGGKEGCKDKERGC